MRIGELNDKSACQVKSFQGKLRKFINAMAIPKFDEITRPLLTYLAECGNPQSKSQIQDELKKRLKLTDEEASETFPSARGISIWRNRLGWAITYLKKAGLIESVSRGVYEITALGRKDSETSAQKLTRDYLRKFPGFDEFIGRPDTGFKKSKQTKQSENDSDESATPEDSIANAFNSLNNALIAELKENVSKMNPFDFEQLVVDLLEAMGYGGLKKGTLATVTQHSNDEGIDGIINQDKLGLDTIYLQAKRWQADIGRKEIQSFVGALAGKHSNKGIFITTSKFCKTALEYVKTVSHKVILIDGDQLADLMIKYNVGVAIYATYALKRIDSDYFIK